MATRETKVASRRAQREHFRSSPYIQSYQETVELFFLYSDALTGCKVVMKKLSACFVHWSWR